MYMSKQRIIKDETWDDEWFYDLDPIEKLVWLFLLTNPRSNIAGVYQMNTRWASGLLGLPNKKLGSILEKFEKQGKIKKVDDWVVILNFHKHQANNPKVEAGVARILAKLPEKVAYVLPIDSLCIAYPTLLNLTQLNSITASADLKVKKKVKKMSWKKPYRESEHGDDDLPEVDLESGEVIDRTAQAREKSRKYLEKKNDLIDAMIARQGRDPIKVNRPKQLKALNRLIEMKVTAKEAQNLLIELETSDYWRGKIEKPDFQTVVALVEKRG